MLKLANDRPYVLCVGGFDPSAGAGILADIKTCEQNGVYGLGVISANTFQTHKQFNEIDWLPEERILAQLKLMLSSYPVAVVKIGLIADFGILNSIRDLTVSYGNPTIVLDPVCKSSSGFGFHKTLDAELLQQVDIITPNWNEIQALSGEKDALKAAEQWSESTTVLLKGGHSNEDKANDYLLENRRKRAILGHRIEGIEKHGSGCVLASAIASQLAKGINTIDACKKGKAYTLAFLQSNKGLLGYHKD